MGLRFANGIFEPLWDRNYIDRVEILWEETLALEGRAGYFDHAGAFKDLIQNHLMQLLCLTAMEAPTALHRRNLRDRKVDLLRAVRRPHARGGRDARPCAPATAPGRIGEKDIPAYADEEGVDPSRGTETFAEVTLMIDNLRWAGVPFVLRGGKALSRFRGEIAVHFKPVPHLAFQRAGDPRPNVLRLRLGPDRVTLNLNVNGPYDPFDLEQIELSAELRPPGVLLRLRARLPRPTSSMAAKASRRRSPACGTTSRCSAVPCTRSATCSRTRPTICTTKIKAEFNDMVHADSATAVLARRKAFLAKWKLRCRAVADSLEEAGERLFTFLRYPPEQWRSLGPRTPSNVCTRSSSAGSKPSACCPAPRPPPCSSGRSWPRVRSPCPGSMAGPPSTAYPPILTSPPGTRPPCRSGPAPCQFPPPSRHDLWAMLAGYQPARHGISTRPTGSALGWWPRA